MNKKAIILGGSGYLGLSLANHLNDNTDYKIVIGDIIKPIATDVEFITLNVLYKETLHDVFKNYDYVINCTGQITKPINTCFQINTTGITNIVNAIKNSKTKLIQISSVAVYGTTDYAEEETEINPESPYGACKAFAEFGIINNLPPEKYCILRVSNLYGENQPKGLFAYLLKAFQSDRLLEFNNNGTLMRYFIHFYDCSEAIRLTLKNNLNGIYNLSAGDRQTVKEIICQIESYSNISFTKQFSLAKPIENIKMLDCSKFISQTGFEPKNSSYKYIQENFNS
jgi:UDP-glucose 4-epimerase